MVELEQTKVLKAILLEQQKTNNLLMLLIEALGEEQDDDRPATSYLSGKPVGG